LGNDPSLLQPDTIDNVGGDPKSLLMRRAGDKAQVAVVIGRTVTRPVGKDTVVVVTEDACDPTKVHHSVFICCSVPT
jgi:hypothetical protein